jgi:regulatory protein
MPFGSRSTKVAEPLTEAGLFDYAVKTLGRKMRTVRDLRKLMAQRAAPDAAGAAAMDSVIARLIELKYLSDERFAQDYTRMRQENERFGRRRVQQDLMQKGVGKELITTTLSDAYDDKDEVGLVLAHLERKRMKPPARPTGKDSTPEARLAHQKATAKIMRRLVRAGFSTGAIWKALRSWANASDEELSGLESVEDDAAEPAE